MPINTVETESDMLLKHVTLLVTPHLTSTGSGDLQKRETAMLIDKHETLEK